MPTLKGFQARGRIHREGHKPPPVYELIASKFPSNPYADHAADAFGYMLSVSYNCKHFSTEHSMNKHQRDSGIPVTIGMLVMAYESTHSHREGKLARLVGLVPPDQRKDSKVIVVCHEDSGNVQRVAKVERVNAFRTETWPINMSELVNMTNNVREKAEDFPEAGPDKPKPRPNNKPENVKAFKTNDDRLHATQGEADVAQLRLDFYEWGEGKVHETFRCSRAKLLKFLIENRTDVAAFLRRAGKIEKDSEA